MQHPQLEHDKLPRLSLVSHKSQVDGTHRGEGVSRWWDGRCEVMRCEERGRSRYGGWCTHDTAGFGLERGLYVRVK